MTWQWTPYAALPLGAALTLIATGLYVLTDHPNEPENRSGAAVLFAAAQLMVAYICWSW
jgi:hypothetical protein